MSVMFLASALLVAAAVFGRPVLKLLRRASTVRR
jgi:hypothetical protein